MKTIGITVVVCSIMLGLVGCSPLSKSTNQANPKVSSSGSSSKTQSEVPSSIVIVSTTNLDEWTVTPSFDTSKSALPIIDMTIKYKGTSAPAENVKISFGDAVSQLKEVTNSDQFVVGTSYGNETKLTFTISWKERNQNMQGTEVLSLR